MSILSQNGLSYARILFFGLSEQEAALPLSVIWERNLGGAFWIALRSAPLD